MPYLTMCIKESLRLTPTVPFIFREVTNPLTLNGIQFEPGTRIELNIWGLHHNPHVWGDDHLVDTIFGSCCIKEHTLSLCYKQRYKKLEILINGSKMLMSKLTSSVFPFHPTLEL